MFTISLFYKNILASVDIIYNQSLCPNLFFQIIFPSILILGLLLFSIFLFVLFLF